MMNMNPVQNNHVHGNEMHSEWRSRGFTLVEMILAIVLISIMAGSIVLSIPGRHQKKALSEAVNDLVLALNYGTAEAGIRGVRYQIEFMDDRKGYCIQSWSEQEGKYIAALDNRWAEKRFCRDVQIAELVFGEQKDVMQYELGDMAKGVSGKVVLKNTNGDSLTIDLSPIGAEIHGENKVLVGSK